VAVKPDWHDLWGVMKQSRIELPTSSEGAHSRKMNTMQTQSPVNLSMTLRPHHSAMPQRAAALACFILAVHALAYSMHDETFEPEDLVRSLGWSSAIAREHGLPLPRDAKTTDVPGHSWILPPVLTHAGVKFFQMGGPLVNKTFSLPRLFWWEGPDGSRLLVVSETSNTMESPWFKAVFDPATVQV